MAEFLDSISGQWPPNRRPHGLADESRLAEVGLDSAGRHGGDRLTAAGDMH
jgi:hypothetical protein